MKIQRNPCPSDVSKDEVEVLEEPEPSHGFTKDQGHVRRSGVKEFGTEEQEWVELALAIGMSYDAVVNAFLSKYPEYRDLDYSDVDLKDILRKRVKAANTKTKRSSYGRIREKSDELEVLCSEFPVMNPFPQIAKLQELFDTSDLRPTEYLKVIEAAQRLRKELFGEESGFSSGKPGSVWEQEDSEVLGNIRFGSKKNVDT